MSETGGREAARKRPAEGGGILGFAFGVVLAVVLGWVFGPFPVVFTIIGAVVLAAVGWRYGDSLWSWILERLRYLVGPS